MDPGLYSTSNRVLLVRRLPACARLSEGVLIRLPTSYVLHVPPAKREKKSQNMTHDPVLGSAPHRPCLARGGASALSPATLLNVLYTDSRFCNAETMRFLTVECPIGQRVGWVEHRCGQYRSHPARDSWLLALTSRQMCLGRRDGSGRMGLSSSHLSCCRPRQRQPTT